MRTNRFAVVAGAVLLLCAAAQNAQAFYNPSTGRWLSRDPIRERGGVNLYAFTGNCPLCRIDPVGDQWEWEQHGEQQAGHLGHDGETWLTGWNINLQVLPCPNGCKKLEVKSPKAGVKYWYDNPSAEKHELTHVWIWHTLWSTLEADVEPYLGKCASMDKIKCYTDTIYLMNDWMIDFGKLLNAGFDYMEYGGGGDVAADVWPDFLAQDFQLYYAMHFCPPPKD
jgi:hypothetical protein